MTDTIDFPDITTPTTAVVTTRPAATAVATVRTAALAPLAAMEGALRALAERYRAVAWDVSTPKGLAAAKAARLELRESGRFKVQRAQKATKDELNGAKTELDETALRMIAIVKPTEDEIDALITAREEAIEAERAAKAAAEAARKQVHEANIAEIRGNVAKAQGRASAELAPAIDALGVLINQFVPDPWEEFAQQALAAMGETREALQVLHDRTKAAEDAAAALKAQQEEQARVAAAQAEAQRRLDEQAAELKRQQEALAAQAKALADAQAAEAARAEEDADIRILTEAANDCIARGSEYIAAAIKRLDETTAPGLTRTPRVSDTLAVARGRMVGALNLATQRETPEVPVQPVALSSVSQVGVGENPDQPQPAAVFTVGDVAADDGAGVASSTSGESLMATPAAGGVTEDDTPLETSEADARPHVAPAADPAATLTVGQINERLVIVRIDAVGLMSLGFERQQRPGPGYNFLASDWPAMCDALVARIAATKAAFL